MAKVTKSIRVNVPVHTAYNQWTQFESFPQFMEGVEQVQQLDDKRLHWRAKIGGKDVEWDAEIMEQVPDQRIAWRNTSGATNAGAVDFHRVGENECEISLTIETEPHGLVETVGDALGFLDRRIEGDMERFKEFIEHQGVETGAYRGEIRGSEVRR
ncbi:MAG TPA: SRPBCC family protein [Candidatus Dormibacteraeota bacterium]